LDATLGEHRGRRLDQPDILGVRRAATTQASVTSHAPMLRRPAEVAARNATRRGSPPGLVATIDGVGTLARPLVSGLVEPGRLPRPGSLGPADRGGVLACRLRGAVGRHATLRLRDHVE